MANSYRYAKFSESPDTETGTVYCTLDLHALRVSCKMLFRIIYALSFCYKIRPHFFIL